MEMALPPTPTSSPVPAKMPSTHPAMSPKGITVMRLMVSEVEMA